MLSGSDLADAIQRAVAAKRLLPGMDRYGSTALAKALGMKQPSASELMKTGRLAKEKYLLLVAEFADVAGPDHWGLPYTRVEMDLLIAFRELSATAQTAVLARLQDAAEKKRAEGEALAAELLDVKAPKATGKLPPPPNIVAHQSKFRLPGIKPEASDPAQTPPEVAPRES